MSSSQPTDQPSVITLNDTNSVHILVQYVEFAQTKGAFLLNEAELLKRASDVLVNNVSDADINANTAKQLLIQGIHKGQRHGAYTLNDAALLAKVVGHILNSLPNVEAVPETPPPTAPATADSINDDDDDDLSDLADPIPLRPKEV